MSRWFQIIISYWFNNAPVSAPDPLTLITLEKAPKVKGKVITLSDTEVTCLKYAIDKWNSAGNNRTRKFDWSAVCNLYLNKCRFEKESNNAVIVYSREVPNLMNYYKDNLIPDKDYVATLNRK